jgi:hypothetical protein
MTMSQVGSAGRWLAVCALLMTCAAPAGAAEAAPYNVNAPVYPVTYTQARKDAQRDAWRRAVRDINVAITAGAKGFAVPPGVYRILAKGPDNEIKLWRVKDFVLNLANTEFILENGGGFIFPRECENLAILGPVKFDADPLVYTQGALLAYDEATGLSTIEVLPGYEVSDSPKGTVDAFSPAGVYLENPSWAGYSECRVLDPARRLIRVKLGAREPMYARIYKPGNLIVLRLHGSPLLLCSDKVRGFTMKDVDVYTGAGFSWGNGTGDWNFIRVRGIPRPGTNRLYGSGGCQRASYGGNVLFDGCEFSVTADDLVDYGGGGLFMCVRQESPRRVITWGGSFSAGDTLNLYTHTDFRPLGSATVAAVAEIIEKNLQAEAHDVCKNINKGRDTGDRALRRVTLDRDVQASPGNFAENASSKRADTFTVRNCYFHDSGVRVMIQGFRHGLFENNRFERISGGLALTVDAWWWGGPVSQDITVRNNVFKDTTFRNAWGTGKAAVIVGSHVAPTDPGLGVAFHRVSITGNTIVDSSSGAILISNASDVIVKDNVITQPFTLAAPAGAIQLTSVDRAQVWGNTVTGCPGAAVVAKNTHGLSIKGTAMEVRIRTSGVLAAVLGAAFLCPCACRAADAPKPPAAGAGEAGLAASAAPTGAARDWRQMLGPGRSGVVECAGLAPQFANGKPPVVWQATAGFGSAPVVVAGGRVYVFGLFKPTAAPAGIAGPQSAPVLDDVAKGTFACGDLPGMPDRVKKSDYPQAFRGGLYALCLDASTGKQVWTSRLTDFGVAFKTTSHSSTAWELASPLTGAVRPPYAFAGHALVTDAELPEGDALKGRWMSLTFGAYAVAPGGRGAYPAGTKTQEGITGVFQIERVVRQQGKNVHLHR